MPKTKQNGNSFVKTRPCGTINWRYDSSDDTIFCKSCSFSLNYSNENFKYRLNSHINTPKHQKNAQFSMKQQRITSVPVSQTNQFFEDVTTAFLQANIPLKNLKTLKLGLFSKNTLVSRCQVNQQH